MEAEKCTKCGEPCMYLKEMGWICVNAECDVLDGEPDYTRGADGTIIPNSPMPEMTPMDEEISRTMAGRGADGMATVLGLLQELRVGEPIQGDNLTAFPLFARGNGGMDYLTLDEALEDQLVQITEVDAGGSVPELKVVNEGNVMVLLLEGDQLIGAKQNRTLNTTLLVAAASEVVVPVSCTEAGRWRSVSAAFRASKRYSHPSLRREKGRGVHASLKRGAGHRSDQAAVWAEVDRVAHSLSASSPTRDYEAVHDAVAGDVERLVDCVHLPDDAVGVAVAFGGRVEVVEIFDRPETLRKVWRKLAHGYAVEALDRRDAHQPPAKVPSSEDVKAFLGRVASEGTMESYPSPGVGQDVRIEVGEATGAALVAGGSVVHCAVFATP